MKGTLHHIALCVQDLDWYTDFFENVFDMSVRKRAGAAPTRKIWFYEGVQLNEVSTHTINGTTFDHFSVQVADISSAVEACLAKGCSKAEGTDNWIVLPNGVKIEFMD